MKGRTLVLIFAVGLMVAMAAPSAQASCSPAKYFTQWDSIGGCYAYVGKDATLRQDFDPNPAAPTGGMIGRLWQAGARSLANEGPICLLNSWLKDDGPYFHVDGGLSGDTGIGPCDPIGCVTGEMIILIETTTTDGKGSAFAVAGANPNADCSQSFDWAYTNGGTWHQIPAPNPPVAVTANVGGALTMSITFPSLADGNFSDPAITSPISSLRLMQAFGTQATPPGRVAANWTFTGTSATSAGTQTVNFSCASAPAGQDVFFAFQPSFDNGQFLGDYVGAATQVRCNSTLSNPGKGKGKGKGHNNQ